MKKNRWIIWFIIAAVIMGIMGSCHTMPTEQPVQTTATLTPPTEQPEQPVQTTATLTPPTEQPIPTEQLRSQSEIFWVEKERIWKESEAVVETLPSLDCGELGEFRPHMRALNEYGWTITTLTEASGSCRFIVPEGYYALWNQKTGKVFVDGRETSGDYPYAKLYGESRLTGEIISIWKSGNTPDTVAIILRKIDIDEEIPSWLELEKSERAIESLPLLDCGKFGSYHPGIIGIDRYYYTAEEYLKTKGDLTLSDLREQGGSCSLTVPEGYYALWEQYGGRAFVNTIEVLPEGKVPEERMLVNLYGEQRLTGKLDSQWEPDSVWIGIFIELRKLKDTPPNWPELKKAWEKSQKEMENLPLLDCGEFGSFGPSMFDVDVYVYRMESSQERGKEDIGVQGGSCSFTVPEGYYALWDTQWSGTTLVNGIKSTREYYNEYSVLYGETHLTGTITTQWEPKESSGFYNYSGVFIELRKLEDKPPNWPELKKVWEESQKEIEDLPLLDCGTFGSFGPSRFGNGYRYDVGMDSVFANGDTYEDFIQQGAICQYIVPDGYYAEWFQEGGVTLINGRQGSSSFNEVSLYGEEHLIGTILAEWEEDSDSRNFLRITLFNQD